MFHWVSFGRASAEMTKSKKTEVAHKIGPDLRYKSALDHGRDFFGDYWVGEVVERAREWRSALRGVRTLSKYHPMWKGRGSSPVGEVCVGGPRGL
jgi:hypothetical protein